MPTRFDPLEIFRVLARHEVEYVTIGGLAATLHGSPLTTGDADVCPARHQANLARLASALADLDARIYSDHEPDGVPLPPDPALLNQAEVWNLTTRAGRLDVSFVPDGTTGYDDLVRDAVLYEIDELTIPAASLADVIRSKEAAGRERDRQALPTLRRLLERIDRGDVKG